MDAIAAHASFQDLLRVAIRRIAACESKAIMQVQQELGVAMGRAGRSYIEFLLKDSHIPEKAQDIEHLASELIRRSDCDVSWLRRFLMRAHYPAAKIDGLVDILFPHSNAPVLSQHAPHQFALPAMHPLPETPAPFIAGLPIMHVRQFFGRTQEIQRIFTVWRQLPLQPVAILGVKRSGKTSLLHYLRMIPTARDVRPDQRTDWLPTPARYRWVFIDFQNPILCTREGFFGAILRQLDLPVSSPCTLSQFMDSMMQAVQQPTILLMDELAAALESPEFDYRFWGSLRSLVSNYTSGRLGVALASHISPAELAHQYENESPFFNLFGHSCTLGPFSEAEARALIDSSPKPFSPADSEWIIQTSKCWPILVQVLCSYRLSALRMGDSSSAWQMEGLRAMAPYHALVEGG